MLTPFMRYSRDNYEITKCFHLPCVVQNSNRTYNCIKSYRRHLSTHVSVRSFVKVLEYEFHQSLNELELEYQ